MAFATIEQGNAKRDLEHSYGKPDMCVIERTDEANGMVRLVWFEAFRETNDAGEEVRKPRILDIRPDGNRVTYTALELT